MREGAVSRYRTDENALSGLPATPADIDIRRERAFAAMLGLLRDIAAGAMHALRPRDRERLHRVIAEAEAVNRASPGGGAAQ